MPQPIPLVDVRAQYAPLVPRLKEAFAEVLESGTFILGPNVKAFEAEAAAYLGVPETVGVANGTDALVLVLDALGIGPGDEVICPAFTFYATAEAVARRGRLGVRVRRDRVRVRQQLRALPPLLRLRAGGRSRARRGVRGIPAGHPATL